MSHKPRHAKPTPVSKAALSAKAAVAGTAAAATVGAFAVGIPAAGAAVLPLPVTLSADGNGTAAFSAHGAPQLDIGSSGTYAQLAVNLGALGQDVAPSAAPSFTTDNYAAGSPRWVIELANGNFIDGYPQQLGAAAKADFSGAQWAVGNSGAYESYSAALAGANDSLGNVKVTNAYIVEDGDQAAGTTDTLSGVQYGGETVSGGTVTVSPVAAQTVTVGTTPAALTVKASTSSSDQALTYSAKGLPDGLTVNSSTGVISGTVAKTAVSGDAVVTAEDAYGDVDTTAVAYTVQQPSATPPTPPTTVTVRLSHGHVVPGTLSNNRAEVAWTATPSAYAYEVTLVGPNFPGGRTNTVKVTEAFYEGLKAGHTYTVYVIPLNADGTQAGPTGHVTFVTKHVAG